MLPLIQDQISHLKGTSSLKHTLRAQLLEWVLPVLTGC